MGGTMTDETKDNIYGIIIVLWAVTLGPMLCALISMFSGIDLFGDLGSSESFFGLWAVILPMIFLVSVLIIDAILADTNELQGDDVPGLIAALNDPTALQNFFDCLQSLS